MFGPARRLALLGPAALENVPCARFGKLLTLDRREIEALRSLRQLMLSYRDGGTRRQPLSLAVFGAPGSGKSFGLIDEVGELGARALESGGVDIGDVVGDHFEILFLGVHARGRDRKRSHASTSLFEPTNSGSVLG